MLDSFHRMTEPTITKKMIPPPTIQRSIKRASIIALAGWGIASFFTIITVTPQFYDLGTKIVVIIFLPFCTALSSFCLGMSKYQLASFMLLVVLFIPGGVGTYGITRWAHLRNKLKPKEPKQKFKFNRTTITVLAFWFGLLMGLRFLLREELLGWHSGIGALAISIIIIMLLLRQKRFQRFNAPIKQTLRSWYTRKAVRVTTIGIGVFFAMLYFTIDFANTHYQDAINYIATDVDITTDILNLKSDTSFGQHIRSYINNQGNTKQPYEILIISIAATDKIWHGIIYNTSFIVFTEDVEFITFIMLLRYKPSLIGMESNQI